MMQAVDGSIVTERCITFARFPLARSCLRHRSWAEIVLTKLYMVLQYVYMTLGIKHGLPSDFCCAQGRHRSRTAVAQTVQQWHVPCRSPALV